VKTIDRIRPSRIACAVLPTPNEKNTESQDMFWAQTPTGYQPALLNTTPTL